MPGIILINSRLNTQRLIRTPRWQAYCHICPIRPICKIDSMQWQANRPLSNSAGAASGLSRLLGITADDLDFVCLNSVIIVKLEVDVFDQKRPNFVAETVGIKVTLGPSACVSRNHLISAATRHDRRVLGTLAAENMRAYLEVQSRLYFVSEDFSYGLVKASHHFHGQLRLDSLLVDHVV